MNYYMIINYDLNYVRTCTRLSNNSFIHVQRYQTRSMSIQDVFLHTPYVHVESLLN